MNPLALELAGILDEHPAVGDLLPVIFGGAKPRFLWHARTLGEADLVAMNQGVSGERVSRVRINGDNRHFYILHG